MAAHLYLIQTEDLTGKILPGVELHATSPNGDWAGRTNPCGQFAPTLGEGAYAVDFFLNGKLIGHRDWVLGDPPLNAIRVGLDPGIPPAPPVDPRRWRGAFCIPDALPGQPDGYGDGKRIWTPAYGTYPDAWRPRILEAFKARGYTHFVINSASELTYHNDYPSLLDDPERLLRDLDEIETAGLLPVVCATDDGKGGTPTRAFVVNGPRIRVFFPMWEMNGPLGVDVMRNGESVGPLGDCARACKAVAPQADGYFHFTSGHGAGAEPEGEWWQWAARVGYLGLLSQDDGYERMPDGDPEGTANGLNDTARHFRGEVAGWEGLHLLNVAFEQITTPLYHDGWTEAQQLAYGARLMQLTASSTNVPGFCDGGPI